MTLFLRMAAACVVASATLIGSLNAAELKKPEDGFPKRPLTVIVPFGAGGGSDAVARAWAAAMEKQIGQPFQAVNKPGGGGLAAVPDFMGAPADGYTIFEQLDFVVGDYVSGKLKLHPAKDWEPLCVVQITFSQIYARADDDRFSDWQGLVEYAKSRPGEVSMANVGNPGTQERLMMIFLQEQTGIDVNQVAFDKPSERYASLIGGQVDLLFEQPGDVRQFIEAGQIKPILTIFDERPKAFADVPTHKEVGAEFQPMLRWRAFWVLPGVPEPRKAYLKEACRHAYNSEQFQAFNKENYMDLIDSFRDSEAFTKLIESEIETYKKAFKAAGL